MPCLFVCKHADSGHFTIRDAVYDDDDTDEEVSAATPLKENRNSFIRNSTLRASACSATASQVNGSFAFSEASNIRI